ncbi:phage terminase small subunit P27 family [Vibrio porteresiae]|uniref:Phage terminase small subunit P27 family n=1 Tax=Vibrio porteresiae DSM 19223 TaxID=1123496 RepID=A0ABZ0Q9R5_9VIBR|nr:phage terminase small subunit P27 family [Vibrio porteresiae]WPC72932.1 phage terminase small subunit P27 family [Vibrio porteresiae DSM 19223]
MPGVSGRSGRPKKPSAKKELAGNPGKRALNKNEPDFGLVTNIICPDWIGEYGRELWETVAPLLCREKILSATDIQNLEVYCTAYHQFRECEINIGKFGLVVTGATGGPVKNPALTAKNEAVKQMSSFGGMLGLDPSSRQRLTGSGKGKEGENPFKDVL